MGLESTSAAASFLNQSQKQQGGRRINHVPLRYNRGSRPFSDISIEGLPVSALVASGGFMGFITLSEAFYAH